MSNNIINMSYGEILDKVDSYNLYGQSIREIYFLILKRKFFTWKEKYNIEIIGDINNFEQPHKLELFLRPYDKNFAQQKGITFVDNCVDIREEYLTIWFEESKLDTIAEWIQFFPNIVDCYLKIDYEGSLNVTYESIIPSWLNKIPKLNMLSIHDYNLEEVPRWLENLLITKLSIGSSCLKSFPYLKKLKYRLEYLVVNDLSLYGNKISLPQNLGEYQNLRVLSLPPLKKLPIDIGKLKNLEEIHLHVAEDYKYHSNPMKVPSFIYNLTKLKVLSISGHYSWIELSNEIEKLQELTILKINRCRVINMPKEIKHLKKLISLRLYLTDVELPDSIKTLPNLDEESKKIILELEAENAWKDITVYGNNDKKDFVNYIDKYPNSIYRKEAEKKINELSNPFKRIRKLLTRSHALRGNAYER